MKGWVAQCPGAAIERGKLLKEVPVEHRNIHTASGLITKELAKDWGEAAKSRASTFLKAFTGRLRDILEHATPPKAASHHQDPRPTVIIQAAGDPP